MSEASGFQPVTRPRLYEQVVSQIQAWIADNRVQVGDRLPPERELAARLGVSRATISQALVAMEVAGMVSVRHGDGVILMEPAGSTKVINALRRHAQPRERRRLQPAGAAPALGLAVAADQPARAARCQRVAPSIAPGLSGAEREGGKIFY